MKLKKIVSGLTSLALSLSVFAGAGRFVQNDAMTASAASNWKFDFGGNGAAGGYTGVSAGDGYNSSRGYGFAQTWNVSNVSASGSGALNDAVKFNSTDKANTFNVDLPKGLYEVKVITGDTSRTSIRAEGMLQLINLTGNNAVETFQLPVTDGQLNIQATEGRAGTAFSLSAIEITQLNTTAETNPTVWICGDSTVANYYNCADSSQHGWGQFFGSYASTKGYIVRNMAASGQYAKGFVDAGQFDAIEAYGKSGDYYIISIGINDTNYSNASEYNTYVTDMVKRAKARGMEVILVKQQGRHGDLTRSPLLSGRWFGGELDSIGAAQNVKVVDLFTEWQNFGLSLGYDGMTPYYATQANGSADDLHQSMLGAKKIAELMAGLVGMTKEPAPLDTSKVYRFKNVNSGLYLEVKDGNAAVGANVQQWGGDNVGDWNTWRLKHKGYNYYEIWSYLGGGNTYLLDVTNGSNASGANIALNTNTNTGAQWFRFFENGDGSYTIVSRCSGDNGAIEVTNALTSSGANVQQWEINGHNCQKWVLEEVETAQTTTTTAVSVTTTTTTVTTLPTVTGIKKRPGDANTDTIVNISDAVMILQAISSPDRFGENGTESSHITAQGMINADVTGDGNGVTTLDALFIQRYLLGVETLPPVEYYEAVITTTAATTAPEPYAGYYFAVDQEWSEGVIEEVNGGFTKTQGVGSSDRTGYINLDNNDTSYITFTVNAAESGNYMTHIRFANGTATDRKMKIYVNGNTNNYWMQSFPGTGSWTDWTEYGIVLPLNAGRNMIRFASSVSGQGGPNLDYITITKTDEPYAEIYDPSKEEQSIVSDKPVIYIAGDSTVQSYREDKAPQQGWGYYLGDYFTDNVTVVNNSIAGRSAKKFYDEGRWKTLEGNLKAGDFVMIQFAINDAGSTNADRYAPTCGNVNNPSSGSYEWYMTEFIKSAKAKGATPILVTTVIGMKAYSDGRFVNSYTNYCDACKQLASKYSIPCIDLNSIMVSHYNSVGYNTALSYHLMGAVQGSTDGTHFTEKGADVVAGLVANAVRSQQIEGLKNYVK